MVAGHLQEKKGYFYIVLSYKDVDGKRKTKWLPTGLLIKGNKKKAEVILMEARKNFKIISEIDDEYILFSDFMLSWLEMMKNNIEVTTYASYSNCIKKRVAPYFTEKKILLKDLQPKHIQTYYQYELNNNKVSANTVIHYHANIRKALQYAVKIDMISSNPADKVERPKKQKFGGSFYDSEEINKLFEVVEDSKIELAVILAAFYGLRRSEVVGLKWDAIDFKNKSITIKHTVTEVSVEGKVIIVEKDRTKNNASHIILQLVPQFENLHAHLDYITKIASANIMVNCLNDKKFSPRIGENLEEK